MIPVNEESAKGSPSNQGDHYEEYESKLLNGVLSLFRHRDTPANAEVPDSESKVVGCCRNTDHVENQDDVTMVGELGIPSIKLNHLGCVIHIFHHGCRDHVINQEQEKEDSGPSLKGVHQVLRESVHAAKVIRLGSRNNEDSVDRMEQQW